MKKITLSFKSTQRDIALYNYIMSLDDKSFYIKEAIRQVFESEVEKELEKLKNADKQKEDEFYRNLELAEMERRKISDANYTGIDRRQKPFNYDNIKK